jgi:hypothetical protein
MRVAFFGEDRIIVLNGPLKGDRAEFLRAPDGGLAWLRFSARIHKKVN